MDNLEVEILSEMLEHETQYNTEPGSILYNMYNGAAKAHAKTQRKIDSILDNYFADTAEGEHLDRVCNKKNVFRKLETYSTGVAEVKGSEGATIRKGELVAFNDLTFEFTENKVVPVEGVVLVGIKCTEPGSIGNVKANTITSFPKTLPGLYEVTNKEPLTNGYDREDDESLRVRYYAVIRTPGTSGNLFDYQNWALSVTGVGGAYVIPRWQGKGTVKVVIIDSNCTGAAEELTQAVFNYIETVRPVDVDVTVISAEEVAINISVNVDFIRAYNEQLIKNQINAVVTDYIKSCAFKRDYISIAKIGSLILDVDGVNDYDNLTINGVEGNASIEKHQVAVFGGIEFC